MLRMLKLLIAMMKFHLQMFDRLAWIVFVIACDGNKARIRTKAILFLKNRRLPDWIDMPVERLFDPELKRALLEAARVDPWGFGEFVVAVKTIKEPVPVDSVSYS